MKEYANFWNFLGSWFPDADLEGIDDDQQVVRNYVAINDHRDIALVRQQCTKVLKLSELPVEHISSQANRYFESESECRAWLTMVCGALHEDT
jgi:hypothetical protein